MQVPRPDRRARRSRRSRIMASGLASEAVRQALRLPAATTPDVEVRRGLEVAMPDGVALVADLYRPRRAAALPTIVVRSPYGRSARWSLLNARILAERGLQILLQSTRGTFGSGGEFDPFVERDDGLATLDWVRAQPWHAGALATTGASYLGLVQWAVAADSPDMAAMAAAVTAPPRRRRLVSPTPPEERSPSPLREGRRGASRRRPDRARGQRSPCVRCAVHAAALDGVRDADPRAFPDPSRRITSATTRPLRPSWPA